MGQKIATGAFAMVQCFFIACALIVAVESFPATTTLVGTATPAVAYYTLGASARKLFDVYIASSCQKTPDRKGMMDL